MRDVWYLVMNPDKSLCLAKGKEDIETVIELIPRTFHNRTWKFESGAWEYMKLMVVSHFLSIFVFFNDILQVTNFILSVIVVCTDNNKYSLPCLFGHLIFCSTGIPLNVIYWSLYDLCVYSVYVLFYSVLLIFYMRLE